MILVVRKGTVQPAISAVFGVGIAAFIAYKTGEAKGFFLFGIWQSVVYGSAFLLSIIVRRPLAGVIWTFLNGRDRSWRDDKASVRDYDIATFVWALVFFARFVVQRWLYDEDQVGWLAVARLGMGYPLMAIALLATVWAVRRADKRLKAAEEAEAKVKAESEAEDVLARTADDLLTPDMDELSASSTPSPATSPETDPAPLLTRPAPPHGGAGRVRLCAHVGEGALGGDGIARPIAARSVSGVSTRCAQA